MAYLGQIFTKSAVAEYMVSLFDIGADAKLLDPCHGEGAFLAALRKRNFTDVTAYEIDSALCSGVKENYPEYNIINADFLQASENILYDGIIMNPPYIRQEKIDELEDYGITKKKLRSNEIYKPLPGTANLYMYFIAKAIKLLNKNGELVVIFPGSWMNASGGKGLWKLILSECGLQREIHLTGDVFEQEPLVEVVILKLVKSRTDIFAAKEYYEVENGCFKSVYEHQPDAGLAFSGAFSELAGVRRGITTGCNLMYINPPLQQETSSECLKPIISSPKEIDGFSTKNARTDFLLFPKSGREVSAEVKEYLEQWKRKIIKEKKPKAIYEKIKADKIWYELREVDSKGILFSYFVRGDMKFVMNEAGTMARDNFYIIKPYIDEAVMFALLNNYYTYYQLEISGKRYGAGLLKLQRYDIEALKFPDYDSIKEEDKQKLEELGISLAETNNSLIIDEITKTIEKYSAVCYTEIREMYYSKRKSRLEAGTGGG